MSTAKKLNIAHTQSDEGAIIAHPAMISPFWDMAFAGGLSLVIYMLISVLFKPMAPDSSVATFVYNLSFAVNFPHFLASYQLLYGDFRHEITRKPRFFFAAVIVPIVLGVGMAQALALSNPLVLGYFVVAMFFFVGWHYVKQTFGVMVVANAYKKVFYNKQERMVLLTNMYALWAVSFFNANAFQSSYAQMGIAYPSLNFGVEPLYASQAVMCVAIVATVLMHFRKYVREGVKPSGTAIMAYLTIYVWLLPAMIHPTFGHMAPFFHSFQYLLFVYVFRKNKVEAQIEELPAVEGRKRRVVGIWGFFAGSIILGGLAFQFVPSFFDHLGILNNALFGGTPFVFFATIFINIHHYFIDNVIWKGNNHEIREYLFKAS